MTATVEHRNDAVRAQLEARLGELRAKFVGELVPAPDETSAATAARCATPATRPSRSSRPTCVRR